MSTTRYLKWLPNALTLSRGLLAVPIFWTALNEDWVLSFWLFILALTTDFLDGLAAKKLDAYSKHGDKYDSAADGVLAAGGVTGLSAAGVLPWGVTIFVLVAGFIMGSRHYWRGWKNIKTVTLELIAKGCLFATWIGTAWFLVALAYGWHWWYVLVTAAVIAASASLKRHRLRDWLGSPKSP